MALLTSPPPKEDEQKVKSYSLSCYKIISTNAGVKGEGRICAERGGYPVQQQLAVEEQIISDSVVFTPGFPVWWS